MVFLAGLTILSVFSIAFLAGFQIGVLQTLKEMGKNKNE